jgi:peptidoglycan/xylan/chitin deacetylase (PgdA/CDA1 family)
VRFAVVGYMQIVEQASPTGVDRAAYSGGDSQMITMAMPLPVTPGTIDLRTTLAVGKLERHFEWYAQNGLQPITLDEIASGKIDARFDPANTAKRLAITFDGGYEAHYRLVLPLLEKWKLRATFFIPPDMIDKPGGLSRGELEIMAKWGHGLGILVPPAELILRMLPPEVQREVGDPRRNLEQIVGRPIQLAATLARHVEAPFLRTMRVHDYRAVAISEMGNHVAREGVHVIARYFHRKNVNPDEWKNVARLATTGPAKNIFYLRSS